MSKEKQRFENHSKISCPYLHIASVIIHERAKAVAEILLEFHLIHIGHIGKRENVMFKLNMLKVA